MSDIVEESKRLVEEFQRQHPGKRIHIGPDGPVLVPVEASKTWFVVLSYAGDPTTGRVIGTHSSWEAAQTQAESTVYAANSFNLIRVVDAYSDHDIALSV